MKEFIIFPFLLIPGVYGLSPSPFPSYRYDWISVRQDFFQVPRPVCFIFYSCYPFLLNLYPGYPSFQKSVFFLFFFFFSFLNYLIYFCFFFTTSTAPPKKKKEKKKGGWGRFVEGRRLIFSFQ
jgi:hypothetical protein